MKAKVNDPTNLKTILEAIGYIIDETYLVFSEAGLEINAMDESHICLVHAILRPAFFDEFDPGPETTKIGVFLEDVAKIVKRVTGDYSLALLYDAEKDSEKIKLEAKGRGTRTFSSRIIEIDEEKIPPTTELDIEFENSAELACGILDEAIKDAEIYQDTLSIGFKEKELSFSAEGEVGDIQYALEATDVDAFAYKADTNLVYSLAFLKNVMKMEKLAPTLCIECGATTPVKIDFVVKDEDVTKPPLAEVTYYLAPRVEEDEESYEDD